ncbi:MAG: hypothetical protein NVV60_03620 [Luteimonas sp.]|nr:hypothetical protein [Luteimonas sp.]
MNGLAYVSVPQGYRYVVEYIDAGIRVQTRTESADFHVGVVTGGSRIDFALPVMPGFTEIDRKTSGQVKLYADPGTRLHVSVSRSNPNVATLGSYAISGCLLPAG